MISNQTSSQKFWGFMKAVGLIFAILGGIAEFSGKNISKWIDKMFGTKQANCLAPNLIGKNETVATLELKQLGFEITQKKIANSNYNIGIVISQYPLPNDEIAGCEGKFFMEISATEKENDNIIKIPSTKNIETQSITESSAISDFIKKAFYVILILFGLYYILYAIYKVFDAIF